MNINDLEKKLIEFNIDLTRWSYNQGTKTLNDLKTEIDNGETTLSIMDNQLVRVVKVASVEVQVKLGKQMFTLIEDKQLFFTGAIRKRGLRNLSEKIRANETPDLAVKRVLKEEIGLNIDKKPIFLGETQESQTSPSYPQLNSVYKLFNYSLFLEQEDLAQIRFVEYQKNSGKITLFTLEGQ